MKKLLVTGSCGLIGSAISAHFTREGWQVIGVDNNARASLFGPEGDIGWNRERMLRELPSFTLHVLDVRDRAALFRLLEEVRPDAVAHTAAQPSHDLATQVPLVDFDINALGTLNLLEAVRLHARHAPFVHLSTNKVYGDAPNELPLRETATRWDYARSEDVNGIRETMRIDQCRHSLYGASKLAADVLVQEYGRSFGLPTCCLRAGCVTGPQHAGVALHGFLSYLIKCHVLGQTYTVHGYKGKQVRDNLHAEDVARFVHAFVEAPRCAEVYNLGGGRGNSCSILEARDRLEALSGMALVLDLREQPREADHLCYISDLTKVRQHYPRWQVTHDLGAIFAAIYQAWRDRLGTEP